MDKPFKSIDEQIAILESRGLECDNNTRLVLEREGYYPVINGYKDLFLDQRGDSCHELFVKGTKFSDIYRLFEFDRSLRLLMFEYFNKAEAVLKTVCSYRFAMPIKIARRHTWIEDPTVPMLVIEKRSTCLLVISRRCCVGLKNGKAIIKGTTFGIMRIITTIRRYGFL